MIIGAAGDSLIGMTTVAYARNPLAASCTRGPSARGSGTAARRGLRARAWRYCLVFGIGTWLGCDAGVFSCDDDAACVGGGVQGVCQATGYCSFPDDSCRESGQRYAELGEPMLAGTCVDLEGTTFEPGSESDGESEPGGDSDGDDPRGAGEQAEPRGDCLVDEFADGTVGLDWCEDVGEGISIAETNGMLRLDFVPSPQGTGERSSQIRSCERTPLSQLVTTVVVVQMPNVDRHSEGYLEVEAGTFGLGIGVNDGHIYAYVTEDGKVLEFGDQSFDPDAHRHWRLRGASEGLVAEVSPDGIAWERLHAHVVDLSAEDGEVLLGAWSGHSPNAADSAIYQSIEVCSKDPDHD